ncbi:hypothetical protein K3495_g4506 [Podosphaera aphanis]|nr:hypothetical protein K3495_g4506 [Podosphaera aphanis]
MLEPVADVDWKCLYSYRRDVDSKATQLLDSILSTQVDRISKYHAIAQYGYDAKDIMLRHCHVNESDPDALSRRYYANSILDHLHRARALEEWQNILNGKFIPLERALGSFDLFVLHDRCGDLSEITQFLDELSEIFLTECPGVDQLPTKAKALATTAFLRKRNLVGFQSSIASPELKSNYVGVTLQNSEHRAIPLISLAIYCALGKRVGLDVRVCGILSYVFAMVYPLPDETTEIIDGEPNTRPMYLDPYRSMEEVSLLSLQSILSDVGIPPVHYDKFLSETTIQNMILRLSSAILATVREYRVRNWNVQSDAHLAINHRVSPNVDIENAKYSALWADLMLRNYFKHMKKPRTQLIPIILQMFETTYPMDGTFIEKHILPFYCNLQSPTRDQIEQALRIVRTADRTPKQVRFRCPEKGFTVKYKIGQVFCHKRYKYTAVITGWDVEGTINSDWQPHSEIISQRRGRHQNFYQALVDDTSIRYVAEENIEIIKPQYPTSLMSMAGKYFKRWDPNSHTFISGIRDEYPDD